MITRCLLIFRAFGSCGIIVLDTTLLDGKRVSAFLRLFVDRKMSCVAFQSISNFEEGKDKFKIDEVVIKTLVAV